MARVFSGETPKLKSLFWKSLKKFSHVSTLLPGLLAIEGFFFSCFYDCFPEIHAFRRVLPDELLLPLCLKDKCFLNSCLIIL